MPDLNKGRGSARPIRRPSSRAAKSGVDVQGLRGIVRPRRGAGAYAYGPSPRCARPRRCAPRRASSSRSWSRRRRGARGPRRARSRDPGTSWGIAPASRALGSPVVETKEASSRRAPARKSVWSRTAWRDLLTESEFDEFFRAKAAASMPKTGSPAPLSSGAHRFGRFSRAPAPDSLPGDGVMKVPKGGSARAYVGRGSKNRECMCRARPRMSARRNSEFRTGSGEPSMRRPQRGSRMALMSAVGDELVVVAVDEAHSPSDLASRLMKSPLPSSSFPPRRPRGSRRRPRARRPRTSAPIGGHEHESNQSPGSRGRRRAPGHAVRRLRTAFRPASWYLA